MHLFPLRVMRVSTNPCRASETIIARGLYIVPFVPLMCVILILLNNISLIVASVKIERERERKSWRYFGFLSIFGSHKGLIKIKSTHTSLQFKHSAYEGRLIGQETHLFRYISIACK